MTTYRGDMMNKKHMKRGQAAMEFLMTYGWAILVVLAAIGALAYFGVLSPDNFLPEQCIVSPEFGNTCLEAQAVATGQQVQLGLRNNVGTTIQNVTVELSDPDGQWTTCSSQDISAEEFSNGARIGTSTAGEPAILTFATCEGVPSSGRFSADIRIEYREQNGAIDHVRTGSLQTKIIE